MFEVDNKEKGILLHKKPLKKLTLLQKLWWKPASQQDIICFLIDHLQTNVAHGAYEKRVLD